jgi:hypothetical protein
MQERNFCCKKLIVIVLNLLLMLAVANQHAQASNQLSYGSPAFLSDKFNGSGQMSLANAIKKIIPQDVKVMFMDVDPNLITRWNYSDAYVLNVLTDFSKKYQFNWELIDNKLLIVGQRPSAHEKPVNSNVLGQDQMTQNMAAPVARTSQTFDQSPMNKMEKGPAEVQSQGRFDIRLDDESLSLAMRRWSIESGYQLVWDVDKDFPAIQTSYHEKSFLDAVVNVMRDIGKTNYPMHTCVYNNMVVRVLPLSTPCERTANGENSGEN